jgi:arginyl-tRNA synthetase
MKEEIKILLKMVLKSMDVTGVEPEVTISDNLGRGEYTSNIALRLAKTLKKSPMDIGLQVKTIIADWKNDPKLAKPYQFTAQSDQSVPAGIEVMDILQDIERVEVVLPGFINIYFSVAKLSNQLTRVTNEEKSYGVKQNQHPKSPPKRIMVEFAHPNTHKAFHIGHLRNITTGESIVRLLESQGNEVIRANYQGDVGMHIAKCLYGILHTQNSTQVLDENRKLSTKEKVEFLGKAYAAGSAAFEKDDKAKIEIGEINKQIYAKDPAIYPLYLETRQWSLDYFDSIYKRLGTHYDRFYFESETYQTGKKYVEEGLEKGIFEKSEGAIIFPGEKFGLHNRVFITSEGNSTYEAKDMGLGRLQFDEYHPDLVIHCVGPEQEGYFKVMFEALGQLFPDTKGKEKHLVYGWVKLKQGKMSSRLGNVVLGEWLLDESKQQICNILQGSKTKGIELDSNTIKGKTEIQKIAEAAAVSAVKYSFLKVGTTQEVSFDFAESINFNGDSGPYLLYSYARCKSVLRKASEQSKQIQSLALNSNYLFNPEEHAVARLILQYPDVVTEAADNLSPSRLCTYLYDLAQAFNLFYAKHKIIGNDNQSFRLILTAATAQVLQNGLYLLGIPTVERM